MRDISFQADTGERIVIAGKNGCGKSTLLQILAGVLRMDRGSLSYFGQDPLADRKAFQSLCGYVPQENPLMEELSVLDNLRLWGYRTKKPDLAVVEQFGLESMMHTRVEHLSGGMKRRVSLACATLSHPRVLFLDEPTNALDISYREGMRQWLDLYRSRGGIVVMTSHDRTEIEQADRCLYMSDGFLYEVTATDLDLSKLLTLTREELDEKYRLSVAGS